MSRCMWMRHEVGVTERCTMDSGHAGRHSGRAELAGIVGLVCFLYELRLRTTARPAVFYNWSNVKIDATLQGDSDEMEGGW